MEIIIMGAGAIGSLIGGLLSHNNKVTLVGHPPHITAIQRMGLRIEGETNFRGQLPAYEDLEEISSPPDILFLTVKSYDTYTAINQASKIISRDTIVCSLQNGLDNIEKISKIIPSSQIVMGVTTHGVELVEPGVIRHTGRGWTKIGVLEEKAYRKAEIVAEVLNKSGFKTIVVDDIKTEIWKKAIINSSINPLTAIFSCRNGYLLENPILKAIMERVCIESTRIAQIEGIPIEVEDMIKLTIEVVENTAGNTSSMLQSILGGKKTEIDSINGVITRIGRKKGYNPVLNEILLKLVEGKTIT